MKLRDDVTMENLLEQATRFIKQDGFLAPVAFLCTPEGVDIYNIENMMRSDSYKEAGVTFLAQRIIEDKAHKMFIVTEAWAYKAPEEMTQEEIQAVIERGEHRQKFEREEIFQVLEVGKDVMRLVTCPFYRNEADNSITVGEQVESDSVTLDRFKPLRDALSTIN